MKPKILFILHYPPPVHGAAMVGKYIKDSTILHSKFQAQYIRLGTTVTFEERRKTTVKKILRFFNLLKNCIYTNLIFKPDLIYLSLNSKGVGFYKDALVVMMLKLTKVKLIYHFHNKGVNTRQNRLLDNYLYKIIFNNVNVILLSENLYPDIQKYVPTNKVHYCPNGIPDAVRENHFTSRIQDNKQPQILFLSNLIESKGVFVLLNACKILKERGINFKCKFVGGEGDVSGVQFNKRIIELKLEDNVAYLGKKYGENKNAIFQEVNIFAFPTYYENECFPLVILEAMQFSLPVISTFEGGIPDIVEDGHSGFLIPQQDVIALADKLEKLIREPELQRRMGNAGREKFSSAFTLSKFEKKISDILMTTIKSK